MRETPSFSFSEEDVFSLALIGFDMIEGPYLKYKKDAKPAPGVKVDLEAFALNFYLAFKGGNGGLKPKAVVYDDFSIFAVPRGLELLCVFLKSDALPRSFSALAKVAKRALTDLDEEEELGEEENARGGGPAETSDQDENNVEEVKRIIVNLLANARMSTPELRRYFHLSSSQIWRIMDDLESSGKVTRAGRAGRAIIWTSK
ncbi:MAG: hypothetical protein Kow0069_06020 [Promethearchaeota archaeon]